MGVAVSINLSIAEIYEFPAMPWFPDDSSSFVGCQYRELLRFVMIEISPFSSLAIGCFFFSVNGSCFCCFFVIAESVDSLGGPVPTKRQRMYFHLDLAPSLLMAAVLGEYSSPLIKPLVHVLIPLQFPNERMPDANTREACFVFAV